MIYRNKVRFLQRVRMSWLAKRENRTERCLVRLGFGPRDVSQSQKRWLKPWQNKEIKKCQVGQTFQSAIWLEGATHALRIPIKVKGTSVNKKRTEGKLGERAREKKKKSKNRCKCVRERESGFRTVECERLKKKKTVFREKSKSGIFSKQGKAQSTTEKYL